MKKAEYRQIRQMIRCRGRKGVIMDNWTNSGVVNPGESFKFITVFSGITNELSGVLSNYNHTDTSKYQCPQKLYFLSFASILNLSKCLLFVYICEVILSITYESSS